ncbi:YbaN family protein [Pontiellaceae bacterium B1224]|nr:YbaN family protein [Pontiellaceae bacterium B1224]
MIGKSKGLYLTAGVLFTALAAVGVIVPLLPTTPLLLLAAGCFARSSEKCHRWLTEHKVFGPIIRNWHENQCIPKKAKIIAVGSILLFGTYAMAFAIENNLVRIIGSIFLLIGLIVVLRIPVCRNH